MPPVLPPSGLPPADRLACGVDGTPFSRTFDDGVKVLHGDSLFGGLGWNVLSDSGRTRNSWGMEWLAAGDAPGHASYLVIVGRDPGELRVGSVWRATAMRRR